MEAVIDTYDANPTPVNSDALATFRQQVRLEDETRPKMSDTAKAKLRSINEHDRRNAEADARLVKEFNSRSWTLEQLMDFMSAAFGRPLLLARRGAIKAMHRLAQGMRVYHIHDVSFFGELLPGESEIPMHRFLAKSEDETVIPTGEPEKPLPLCKAGKKCLRYEKRRAAPAKGRGEYCGSACAASVRARAKRASTAPTIQ